MLPLAALLVASVASNPAPTRSEPLAGLEIVEQLDAPLPLDARFRDDTGREVTLGSIFGSGRPVVLALVYYDCPMLCNLVLNGVVEAVREVGLDPARDFEVVAVSIDPAETPTLASAKKGTYVKALGIQEAAARWHFLTGTPEGIGRLASAVGFRYRYDAASGEYAHAAAIYVATPDGRLARYLYGVRYPPRDLRLALVEASEGRVGSSMDRVFLACYDWDRSTGTYGLAAMRLMQIGGGLTALLLGGLLAALWRREHRTA